MSANRSSISIIGERTGLHAQGYFVYDSKKSGSTTVSHLRFGPRPIRSTYLIERAGFVACHQFGLLEKLDVLSVAEPGATVLLNAPYGPDEVWEHLPVIVQEQIREKSLRLFVVDASLVAREAGLGRRVNTVLQTCFFALSGVLPLDEAIDAVKEATRTTYGKRGEAVIARNLAAIDHAIERMHEVSIPAATDSPVVASVGSGLALEGESAFVHDVTAVMLAGRGDTLPVSALPADGTFPSGTSRVEKRSIAEEIPIWDPSICIDCAKCAIVCPHAAIRMKVFAPEALDGAPEGFQSKEWRDRHLPGMRMTIQVAPDDCTGCGICVETCPAHSKEEVKHRSINLEPKLEHLEARARPLPLLPRAPRAAAHERRPCHREGLAGPAAALRVLRRLRGLRRDAVPQDPHASCSATACCVANATGLLVDLRRQPADDAVDDRRARARAGVVELALRGQRRVRARHAARARRAAASRREALTVALARRRPRGRARSAPTSRPRRRSPSSASASRPLLARRRRDRRPGGATARGARRGPLVRTSVWIVGGDGWAYDIGFGGLDHVLASGADVNVLVLDTEVYSNTGGQASKATPRGAVAKFAAGGKQTTKKDLGADRVGVRPRLRRADRDRRRQRPDRARRSRRPRPGTARRS